MEFSTLLENGLLKAGQRLFFAGDESRFARIKPDARLRTADGFEGSIHKAGSHYMDGAPCNGWEHWYLRENGGMIRLDVYRQRYRVDYLRHAMA